MCNFSALTAKLAPMLKNMGQEVVSGSC